MVASCTPWLASVTVSRSGHLVALMRLRNSVSSASGTFTENGRMALSPETRSPLRWVAVVGVMVSFSFEVDFRNLRMKRPNAATCATTEHHQISSGAASSYNGHTHRRLL